MNVQEETLDLLGSEYSNSEEEIVKQKSSLSCDKFKCCLTPEEIEVPIVDTPIFPKTSQWCLEFSNFPQRGIVLVVCLICSCALLALLYFFTAFNANTPYGAPAHYGCVSQVYGRWCGVNGVDCLPLESGWWPARCDPLCSKYKNRLPVIGTGIYRGDSDICASATHAGVIGPMGGCFLMRAAGPQSNFTSSENAGITSFKWPTYFPKSIEFKACDSVFCVPLQWLILVVNIATAFLLVLLRAPKWLYFFYILHTGWWYIAVSGMKDAQHSDSFLDHVASTFIPSFAIGYVLYKYGSMAVFSHKYPFDALIFYIVPAWIAIHWNYLTLIVPDIDFTPSTVSGEHANSLVAVIITLCVAIVIAAIILIPQIYYIWKSGLLKHYLLYYFALISTVGLAVLAVHNHLEFHLHHYLLAIVGWPLTRFNTRTSAVLQAFLLGLFINGAARWGFGSLLVAKNGAHYPNPPTDLWISYWKDQTVGLNWNASSSCTAYSVQMNDYEVYRGALPYTNISIPVPDLFYHFCVKCLDGGTLGRCSEFLSVLATFPQH